MHAIDPTIRFLTKFPAHSIFLKGEYHYSPLLSSVNLQTILLQIRAYGACDCGQGNHPAARQSALGTQARQRVAARPRAAGAALSTSTQVRICPRSAWTAPRVVPRAPRAVPRAAHAAYRCARASHSAARLPRGARHAKPQPVSTMVLRSYYRQLFAYARARALSLLATKVCRLLPAVTCTCSSTSVQQLPPRCSLLAAKVRCCPTGPTLSPRPAPHLPAPCLSLPPSLPPAPLWPSSAGSRRPRPPPPACTGPRRPCSLLSPCHVQRAHAHSCQRTRTGELTMYCFGLQ